MQPARSLTDRQSRPHQRHPSVCRYGGRPSSQDWASVSVRVPSQAEAQAPSMQALLRQLPEQVFPAAGSWGVHQASCIVAAGFLFICCCRMSSNFWCRVSASTMWWPYTMPAEASVQPLLHSPTSTQYTSTEHCLWSCRHISRRSDDTQGPYSAAGSRCSQAAMQAGLGGCAGQCITLPGGHTICCAL